MAHLTAGSGSRSRDPSADRASPQVGDPAPDATLTDDSGNKVTLSSYWSQKPVVLVFLRHFGCPFCREQVVRLSADYQKIAADGAEVACIGQGPYKAGKAFSIYFDLPFPVLVCEDDLSIYSRYGLSKGAFRQLFGLNVFIRGIAALRNGIGPVEGDPRQLPGAFVVDTNGTVLLAHRAVDQADYLSLNRLHAALKRDGPLNR